VEWLECVSDGTFECGYLCAAHRLDVIANESDENELDVVRLVDEFRRSDHAVVAVVIHKVGRKLWRTASAASDHLER